MFALAVLVFIILLIYIVYYESRRLELSFHILPLDKLPPAFENFKIVQISDVHYPFYITKSELERVRDIINDEKADLLLLTGDLITSRDNRRMECLEILAGIGPKYGSFAVLGNHDYCYGRKTLQFKLKDHGIRVLKNEHVFIISQDSQIQLLGLDDPATFRDDPEMLFSGLQDTKIRIAITHAPAGIQNLLKENVALILTGHTHGGQIRLPFLGAVYMPLKSMREYQSGWYKRKDTWIYVNRGIGYAMIPLRILCPREITFITLTSQGKYIKSRRRRIFL